jgi:hypothetical protein
MATVDEVPVEEGQRQWELGSEVEGDDVQARERHGACKLLTEATTG